MKNETEVLEIVPDVPQGLDIGLRNYWYPILDSEELTEGKPVGLTVLGEDLVAWRDVRGMPCVVNDRCPHRGARLAMGRVLDGRIQCALHGLRFDGEGRCVLIPWEPEDSKLLDEISVSGYPTGELGGYIWAYLGDTVEFPPPPLADEVPEELLDEGNFICFRMPTKVWDANWLLTIDGADEFHAVTLHADSQAVKDNAWKPGKTEHVGIPLADRRVKLVRTPGGLHGVATDRAGEPIHHGHFLDGRKGERFTLPGTFHIPIHPAVGAPPYTSRVWHVAIDDRRTLVPRYLCWRASTAEERERAEQVYHDLALPRLQKVAEEDALISAGMGDLVTARKNEFLFNADSEVIRIRRDLKAAFLAQREGQRIAVPKDALVFPA